MKKRKDQRYVETITIELPSGQKKRKFFYGSTPREAKQKMLAYSGEKASGRKFATVADEWWEHHQKGIRHNTASCYQAPLKDVKAYFDDWLVKSIMPTDIQLFITNYALEGSALKPRARHTVELRLNVLSLIFKWASFCRDILVSPVQGIEIPAVCKAKRRMPPSASQIQRLERLPAAENRPAGNFALYPALLLYTGWRRCEALGLKWEDIDWDERKINMNRMVEFHGNSPVVIENRAKSTEGENRQTPLMQKLYDVLYPHRGEGFVFVGHSGGPMTKGEFTSRWRKLDLGITAHQLRHAFATKAYDAGIDSRTLQQLLGVSSEKVAREIYTHVEESRRLQNAGNLLDAAECSQNVVKAAASPVNSNTFM